MQDNRLWLLMSRRLSGEASPAELEELQALLESSPANHHLLDILHDYFNAASGVRSVGTLEGPDLDERFRKIVSGRPGGPEDKNGNEDAIGEKSANESTGGDKSASDNENETGQEEGVLPFIKPRRKVWYRYAAAAAVALALGWGSLKLFHKSHSAEPLKELAGGEILARPGTRTRLVLSDGTQVWLNSNSKLKYGSDFNTRSREVQLEGEAYFDVARNAERPFVVHSSNIAIRVLGTSFTVKSYESDETVEATLLRGAIEVSRQDNPNAPRVILKPNEKLIFRKHPLAAVVIDSKRRSRGGASVTVPSDISVNTIPINVPDSEKVETSWMYNKLVFSGDSFRELADKMERWYNVKIDLRDEGLYKYRFGGVFTQETIEQALHALQLTARFSYHIRGSQVDIYEK